MSTTIDSVQNIAPSIQYVATAGQTVYPYPFPIPAVADLVVDVNGVATGAFTVTGVGNDLGGNVTLTTPSTVGDIVTVYRNIPISRTTQFQQNGPLTALALNGEFNNIYLLLQQAAASQALGLSVPATNNPAPSTVLTPAAYANKYLAFDSNGNPTPALLTPSGTLTQAIIGGFLYPQTTAETNAGVVPTNYGFQFGDLRRYGGDPTNTTDSSSALQKALNVGSAVFAYGCRYMIGTAVTQNKPVNMTGEGPTSGISADNVWINTTASTCSYSTYDNFDQIPITTPTLFKRNVYTTVTTTANSTANGATIVVASATGIRVGMQAFGRGLWNGTIVTGVAGTTITLANVSSQTLSGAPVLFYDITFNLGSTAAATLTSTLADGYRPLSVNDVDVQTAMGATPFNAAILAGQKGPVMNINGDHMTVSRLTGKCISLLFSNCNYSKARDNNFKGGWTWGCIAFINSSAGRNRGNSATNNRIYDHAYEGILIEGQDGFVVSGNQILGCGDSGIETYQTGPGTTPVSTYFDGASGFVSSGNSVIGCYQGGLNYESNYGTGVIGYNTASSTSSGDYCAWCPSGGAAFTGNGWSITGLVCELNGGEAVFATMSSSTMSNCVFRENQYLNYGSFSAVTIVGNANMLVNIRAFQDTNRSTQYTMNVNAGAGGSITANTTMRDIDLRDAVTPPASQLLLGGPVYRDNVRVGNVGGSIGTLDCPPGMYSAVSLATSTSLTAGTNTVVPFATVTYDNYALWDGTNHRFIGMPSGKYRVTATVLFQTTASTAVDAYLYIAKNGVTGAANQACLHCTPTATGQNYTLTSVIDVAIAAITDYVQCIVQPYNTAMSIGGAQCTMSIERLGD